MTTHRSQVWPGLGQDLVLQEIETHKVPADHVLIKVTAVAINPGDFKIQGAYSAVLQLSFPSNLGTDGVGIIADVGEGVTHVALGDRVLFNGMPGYASGAYQEYSLQPSFAVGKVPDQLSDLEAATIPVGSATALAIFNVLNIPPPWENPSFGAGQNIFIPGGASSVGQFAIQLASLAGFTNIITTGSVHNEALLRGLGATTFIDRHLLPHEQVEQVFRAVGTGIVPFVADAVSSPETLETSFKVAQKDSKGAGKVGAVLFIPDVITAKYPDVKSKYTFGNVRDDPVVASGFFEHLSKYVAEGLYKPNPIKVVGDSLEDIPAGIELMKKGVSGQKLVISYSQV